MSKSEPFNIVRQAFTEATNSKGILAHVSDGVLEILTLGILLTLKPAAGINVFSKPFAVPKNVISS
jgi:hypothetical protein